MHNVPAESAISCAFAQSEEALDLIRDDTHRIDGNYVFEDVEWFKPTPSLLLLHQVI